MVDEIQSENSIVIDLFADVYAIDALFEYGWIRGMTSRIVKLNTKEHKGNELYFPQICADVFTCLPDRFVDDICSNDYLMDSFFSIPTVLLDSR